MAGQRSTSPAEVEKAYPEPNAQEAIFFFNMIKNMNNAPDINWDGVAHDCGFKNSAVAKKRFYQIKVKLGLTEFETGRNGGTSSPAKARANRKARAGPASGSGLGTTSTFSPGTHDPTVTAAASPIPSKVTKARKPANTRKKTPAPTYTAPTPALDDDEDEEEEDEPTIKTEDNKKVEGGYLQDSDKDDEYDSNEGL